MHSQSVLVLFIGTILTRQVHGQKDLNLMGFFPLTGNGWTGGGSLIPATEMAIRDVNSRSDILPGFQLNLIWLDTKCHAGLSIDSLYTLLYSPPVKHMVLGPACSTEAEVQGQASHLWNISHFSYSASSPVLSDKTVYPKFYRTITSDPVHNMAKVALIKLFGWTKIATINVALNKFSAVINDFVQSVKDTDITIISQEIFVKDPLLRIMNLKSKDARIILAEGYEESGRAILCAAYRVGLYGSKIVWIFPGLYGEHWWRHSLDGIPCTSEQMDAAALGHFQVTSSKRSSENVPGISGMQVSEFDTRFLLEPSYSAKYQKFDYMGPLMYDTVWAAAMSLNCTISEMQLQNYSKTLDLFTYSDGDIGDIMTSCMKNVSFHGISGHVAFDKGGQPLKNLEIIQIQDLQKVNTGKYILEEEPYRFEWKGDGIIWRDGVPPRDSTQVTLIKTAIPESLYMTMTCLSSAGILMATMFFIFNIVYRNHKYIKMSSPNINNVLILGCLLSYSTVFMYNSENSNYGVLPCKMRHFTFTIGFTMSFGAMFSKTWRVYKIFCNKRLLRIKIQDSQLVVIVVLLVGVMLAILIVWEIIDSLYIQTIYLNNQNFMIGNDAEAHPYLLGCTSDYYNHFLLTICILEGVLLAFGAFLSFETRKVKIVALNDSQHIGMCLYNVIILSALGVTLSILLEHQVALLYGIVSGFVILGTTATLMIVFVPKIHGVFYPNIVEPGNTQQEAMVNQSATTLSYNSNFSGTQLRSITKQTATTSSNVSNCDCT